MRKYWLLGLAAAITLLVGVLVPAAEAQDKRLYWENYDVDITVQPDGALRVKELQELVFTSGTFTYGIRHIPTEFLARISNVQVSEADGTVYQQSDSGEPYTFSTSEAGGEFNIRYNFPPTSDASRTMVLEYTVDGALLYYPDGDQLVWKAVPADPNIPIQHASVTIHLPAGATVDNYDATGPRGEAELIDGGQGVRFETTEPMRGGPDFAVRVQWPTGIVAGSPSSWQQQMDFEDRWTPVFDVAALSLSLFLLVVGPLLLYLLWYRKGRDIPVKLPAEWIPEPPSDLPPGMVGTLIDERADTKDVIATLVDLAHRGVLAIQEEKTPGFLGIGEKRDFIYHLEDPSRPMRPYEKDLIDKLFDGDQEKRLSDLRDKFFVHMDKLQSALYEATVAEGYFVSNPERVRTTYGVLGVIALVVTAVIGCLVLITLTTLTGFAVCIPAALGVSAIGLVILARYMPRKTAQGAEEAAKWLAFKRYMQDLEKYTKVEEATAIFDKYLPYAIAFGLEDSWIAKFARVDAPPPPWYYPGPYTGPRPYWTWGPVTAGGGQPAGPSMAEGGKPPSLGDASRGLGRGLSSMSAGLGAMLTSAAATMTSRPAAQQGGGIWSSGGGSWSGGGGFSGGGWSGGGSFGGGGGGGSSFG